MNAASKKNIKTASKSIKLNDIKNKSDGATKPDIFTKQERARAVECLEGKIKQKEAKSELVKYIKNLEKRMENKTPSKTSFSFLGYNKYSAQDKMEAAKALQEFS